MQILKNRTGYTKPPVSLVGQLFWREFFYTVGYATPNFEKMEGNPLSKQVNLTNNLKCPAADNLCYALPDRAAINTMIRLHHETNGRFAIKCTLQCGQTIRNNTLPTCL